MLDRYLEQLKSTPEQISFDQTIELIDQMYDYTPTTFSNGKQINKAGINGGSCKILYFGQINGITEEHILHCFGDYYRKEVLDNPDGQDHSNIRDFMQYGWQGVVFEGVALTQKSGR